MVGFAPHDCAYAFGTPYEGYVRLGDIVFDAYKIEFNGYYKGKIQNQQYSPTYSPFGSTVLKGQLFPPKWIFNFRSCLITEAELVELFNMQALAQSRFANRTSGGILLEDRWQPPFLTTSVIIVLPEDIASNLVGRGKDPQPIYRVSFTAVEL